MNEQLRRCRYGSELPLEGRRGSAQLTSPGDARGLGPYGGELSGLSYCGEPPGEAVLDHFEVDEPLPR